METKQTFTGTSPSRIVWGKKEIFWLASVWLAFITWSYMSSSFFPIMVIVVLSIVSVLIRLPGLKRRIDIRIGDDALSIHSDNAVLWSTQLKDITSIELEESERAFSRALNKALLIRNNKNDSYFLPLDGMTFEGLEADELVEKLNETVR